MDFLDLCRRRQSVRDYAPAGVPRELLDRCLEAARLAPSACNSQPWSFIVVDDRELKDRLAGAAFSGLHAMNRFAGAAPVLVAVVTERSRYAAALAGRFRGTPYNLIDIGIACEHFVLAAAEQGLGTCWLGWFDQKAVKRVLGLPRGSRIDILISLGYPAQPQTREKVRKPIEKIRRFHRGA